MRWILASVGALALANVVASPPAWADNPDEEKVVASERFEAIVDGLDPGLVERALAEVKEHHPAVQAKGHEGLLKIRSEDVKAFEAAMVALEKLGVPMGGDMKTTMGGGEHAKAGALRDGPKRKPLRSDKDVEQHIDALEKMLGAAREAGRQQEVAWLEQALEDLRRQRKELAAMREKAGQGEHGQDGGKLRERLAEVNAKLGLLEKKLVEAREAGREREVEEIEQLLGKLRAQRKEWDGMLGKGGERPDKARPNTLEAKLEHIEKKLAEAREAGREREVQELEQALVQVRTMRRQARAEGEQGPNLDELRQRLEQAKRALHQAEEAREQRMPRFEMDEVEELEIRRALQALGAEVGRERDAQRRGPGAPNRDMPLQQRMEHTRAALRHLKEAGLVDQAQQVERALHRMEMAQQGEGRPPAPPPPPVAAPQPRLVPAPAGPPRAFSPPMPMPAPEGPPPSVGGVRRGPIHPRLRRQLYLPRPPGAQGSPPPAPVVVPGTPRQASAFELEAPAGEGPTVLVGRGSDWVIETVEVGGEMRLSPPPAPQVDRAVRLKVVPARPGAERVEFPPPNASQNESARQIEELRAELQQLKEMLKGLAKQLEAEHR